MSSTFPRPSYILIIYSSSSFIISSFIIVHLYSLYRCMFDCHVEVWPVRVNCKSKFILSGQGHDGQLTSSHPVSVITSMHVTRFLLSLVGSRSARLRRPMREATAWRTCMYMLILYSVFFNDSIGIFMRYPCLKIMSVFHITLRIYDLLCSMPWFK